MSGERFKNILHFDVWHKTSAGNHTYFVIVHVEGKEKKMHALANPHVHLCQYLTRPSL